MPVKIRLRRVGRKKQPSYRIVVADSRTPRDGAYVDSIGFYNPRRHPAELRLDMDSLDEWLNKGAQPTETVASLIRKARRGGDTKVAFLKEEERPPVTAAVAESVSAASEAVSAPASDAAAPPAETAPLATETSAEEEAAVEEAAAAAEPEARAPTRKPAKPGSKGSGEAKVSTAAPKAESAPAPEEAETEEPAAAEGGGAEAEERSAE